MCVNQIRNKDFPLMSSALNMRPFIGICLPSAATKQKHHVLKKILIAALVVALVSVIGTTSILFGLIINRQNQFELEHLVLTESPWGSEGVWLSDDETSCLVCTAQPDTDISYVTGYFKTEDGLVSYEINCMRKMVYLNLPHSTEMYWGYMDFDGTTFEIEKLEGCPDDAPLLPAAAYEYTRLDKPFDLAVWSETP